MALLKKIKDKGSHTLVTFTIGSEEVNGSSQVSLLGDFNNWHSNDIACQMEKKGKSFTKSIKLENGKRYEFRYLSEASGWYNDSAADAYKPSPFSGVDNSVVDLTVLPEKKKPVVKKTTKTKKDDLKKIEGIGPKIASILVEKKIDTFEKLSDATVSTLEEILKEAGPRYKMHKPGSWPKQAKLAFEGKWDALKKLQDKLDGGK
jgi:predicted flap endonuclease-1-like 5' DNA nuclease